MDANTDHARYIVHIKQMAKYVVDIDQSLSPTDVEEGMRIGVEKKKYKIVLPLPPKIDPSVSLMTVEDRPDVSYNDIGGYKEQIDKLREVLELPLLNPQVFNQDVSNPQTSKLEEILQLLSEKLNYIKMNPWDVLRIAIIME